MSLNKHKHSTRREYLRADFQGFATQTLWHLPAAGGQVEDGGGCHVCRLHVVGVVETTFAAGAAGAALSASGPTPGSSPSAAQTAGTAAGPVAAGGAARRAGALAVALGCGTDTQA